MSIILNEWLPTTDPETTMLRMTGVYVHDVLVQTTAVPHLKPLSWCYEQSKGHTYATDFTLEIPSLLGVSSPRVYLCKYIVYINTGRIAKGWKRVNFNDYRYNQGQVIWQEATPVSPVR
jgi:hypothetical protein